MKIPLQIRYRGLEPSVFVEEWVRDEVDKLEAFYGAITRCRVVLEVPHAHHERGNRYHVGVVLTVPGGEVVVKREPSLAQHARRSGAAKFGKHLEVAAPHKDLRQAINDAFQAAGRRLQDFASRRRGGVKTHQGPQRAHVLRLVPGKGCGFLATEDGLEVYFHRNSVLQPGFESLQPGSLVTFVEERGEKGPQASSVRPRKVRRASAQGRPLAIAVP